MLPTKSSREGIQIFRNGDHRFIFVDSLVKGSTMQPLWRLPYGSSYTKQLLFPNLRVNKSEKYFENLTIS